MFGSHDYNVVPYKYKKGSIAGSGEIKKGISGANSIVLCAFFMYFAILSGTRACLIAMAVIILQF